MNENNNAILPVTRSRGNDQQGRRFKFRGSKGVSSTAFKGMVSEMNGQVFQFRTERKRKDQFYNTLESLKIYASVKFSEDIAYLDPLFRRLRKPSITPPNKSEATVIEDEDDEETVIPIDKLDVEVYKERMKRYDKKVERLESTLRALYNVVWAQRSDLLRNQLKGTPRFRHH